MMEQYAIFETALPAQEFLQFEETVGDLVESLNWDEGRVRGMVDVSRRAELEARIGTALSWHPVERIDWLEEDEKKLPPMTVGKLFIYTPHHAVQAPADKISLQLRSSHAFGSGHHPTTEGCLQAIQTLDRVKRALDIGCGSGILALAIEALFGAKVIASEIDARSVEIARENAAGKIAVVHTTGISAPEIVGNAPYDLIVSNIHSQPLIEMAASIVPLLAEGGVLILAGLLEEQRAEVENAYSALRVEGVYGSDPMWPVLKLNRKI